MEGPYSYYGTWETDYLLGEKMAKLYSIDSISDPVDNTAVKIGDEVYGARPDQHGPIGGGNGYADNTTEGDYMVQNLDSLLKCSDASWRFHSNEPFPVDRLQGSGVFNLCLDLIHHSTVSKVITLLPRPSFTDS